MVQPIRPQTTITIPVSVSGFGFWSGQDVTIEFHPAAENSGVVFVRTDLPSNPRIPATVQYRQPGPRRTTLAKDGHAVEMVEHLLSALAGLQIDNVEIRVDRPEMPGVDGSSLPFVKALLTAGKIEQNALRAITEVTQSTTIGNDQARIEIEPSTTGNFELCFHVDYPTCDPIGQQRYQTSVAPEDYITQIAPARTFVLESEAEQLRQQGLGSRVKFQDILVFNQSGPIENSLRFDNECARHKVLDMIGDLALIGTDIVGKFTAFKTGHKLNAQVVLELLRQCDSQINKNRLSA